MDPVEAGDWIAGRPLQLVFLTGLDPKNKPHHQTIVNTLRQRTPDKPPLQLRVISGELDLPTKREKHIEKGILRKEWPKKYLECIPALIVIFVDLDWNHPSWEEKKLEVESKIASIRSSLRHGTKIALVMVQERVVSTSTDESEAADRAHEICHTCSLTSKQLFILPYHEDINGYCKKLETAFHEIAQGFYQTKLKAIRARNIPNNSPALVVRQLFKLAFISELRQDTHAALRNYRLAYDQCKDTVDQWEGVDIFEWRSVTGLLNYKMCELCFLHSTALEAINQMRKHQSVFFSSSPGIYPTPHLASIELLLWKAKQCWHFAQLFEQAVVGGLSALSTLNPGTHLDQAAHIYASANTEIEALKRHTPINTPYPNPDPLTNTTVFFGQRPWRVGYEGLTTAEIEASAVNAITQRLVINHEGVISLFTAAMTQYKKYGCIRMQKKVMCEMAKSCHQNNEIPKALQLWSLVARDTAVPYVIRKDIMYRSTWAAYTIGSVKDYVACCFQAIGPGYASLLPSQCYQSLTDILARQVPRVPFPNDEVSPQQLSSYQQMWQHALSERQFFSITASKIEPFLDVTVSFLEKQQANINSRVPVRIEFLSSLDQVFVFSDVVVTCKMKGMAPNEVVLFDPIRVGRIEVSAAKSAKHVVFLDLKRAKLNHVVTVSKVSLEIGDRNSHIFGEIEYDENSLNRRFHIDDVIGVEMLKISGVKNGVMLENEVKMDCLIAEVAKTELKFANVSKNFIRNVKLDFKRNEQKFTEAAAILFYEEGGLELKSELSIDVAARLAVDEKITVPLMFSAQLTGSYELQLELSYEYEDDGEMRKEVNNVKIAVSAKEPFTVTSGVLNMNGIPMASILNHCEHILNVNIESSASIIISSIEFLLADTVSIIDSASGGAGINLKDEVNEGEMICYSAAICVAANEEDSETPLGRLAIEWTRAAPNSCPVRSVVPLCRVPVVACPVSIRALLKTNPATVRQPIDICFELKSHSNEAIEITANFDLEDVFMFSGERKVTMMVLPNGIRRINVVVMALSAGRLNFPKISLRSTQVSEQLLQHALRTLPATIFVMPKSKEMATVG